jgi:hypothetical protein
VSFHRHYGDDVEDNGVIKSQHGTSEAVMRSQFRAWAQYMAPALAKAPGAAATTAATQGASA